MQKIFGVGAFIFLASTLVGCSKPEPQAELDELAAVKRESKALNDQLDGVGARMLVGRSVITADADLRERHQKVSQVACANMSNNWAGINRFLDNQADKIKHKQRARVASAERE